MTQETKQTATSVDWNALVEQKRHVDKLQQQLELARGTVRDLREELQAAEARLLAMIETGAQKRLPLEDGVVQEGDRHDRSANR